jgi:hypothetical protein
MKDIPAIVQSHMAKRIALYGQEPEQPLVEELFQRYSQLQSTNDRAFLDAFQKLDAFMEPLSVDATQAASQVVCDLCSETERMAFIIGLHAGMKFAWEVTEPTEVKL